MANKKISQLDSRASLSLSDLMAVGDPSTGYLYKTTISDLKTLTGAGVISFNGRFGAVSPAEGDYTLTQLGDVIITSASNGQVLKFNGSNWVNAAEAAETDTLATVTARGNKTTTKIYSEGADRVAFLDGGNMAIGFAYVGGGGSPYGLPLSAYMHTDGSNSLFLSTSDVLKAATIFGATGNMAIGSTTDGGFKLDVNGNVRVQGNITVTNAGNLTTSNQFYAGTTNYANSIFVGWDNGAVYLGYSMGALPIHLGTNGTGEIRFRNTGGFKIDSFVGTGSRMVVADADGILSTQAIPSLSGYVPYTGATANVNLGSNNLTTTGLVTANGVTSMSINIDGNGSSGGALNIKHNATTQVAGAGYVSIGAKDANTFYLYYTGATNANWKSVSLKTTNITNATGRVYEFPNADGTLALTSDIPSLTNYVTLNGTQTISGAKTFSAIPVIDNGSSGMGLRFKMYASSSFGLNGYMDIAPINNQGIVGFAFGISSTVTKLAYISAAGLTDNTARTFALPDASGTLALTSNLASYVPYTGATGSLFLGSNDLESRFVMIEGDGTLGGILSFKQYASSWQSTTDHTNIYATGSNKLNFSFFQTGGGGKFFNFDVSSLGSTGRTYTMPDASGTLALTSQLSAYLPLAGGVLTGKIAGVNLEFSNPSATFVSGGVNNSISTHIIAVPSGSTWSNGSSFSASNNAQFLNFGGSQTIQNGSVVAATVNVNRISFTASSSTVTLTQSTGIRAIAGMQMLQQTGGTINGTVSHGASMLVQGVYPTNTANVTFTNYYGVLINPLDEWGGVTFGSRYGIYQAGASDANFFAGATLFGSSVTAGGRIISGPGAYANGGFVIPYTTASASSRNWKMTNDEISFGDFTIKQSSTQTGESDIHRLYISPGGNVGIGTTSPIDKLTVSGRLNLLGLNQNAVWFNQNAGGTSTGFLVGRSYTSADTQDFFIYDVAAAAPRLFITSGGDLIFPGQSNSKIHFYNAYSGSPANVGLALFNTSGTTVIALNGNGGSIYAASLGTGTVYSNGGTLTTTNPSDSRLKENINNISWGLNEILKLRPVHYTWKNDKIDQGVQFGFIAQEVQEIMPESIKEFGDETKYLGLEKDAIYATLVKAIQELKAELDTLKNN